MVRKLISIIICNTTVFVTIFIYLVKSQEEVFLPTKHQINFNSNSDQLISTSMNSRQLVDVPILVSSLNYTNTAHQDQTNNYVNSQAQKFRVNVSNICEKSNMRITIRLNKPFYGLIHTKDKRKKTACSVEGNGDQVYTLEISYTLVQSEPSYCGIVSHHLTQPVQQKQNQSALQQQQTLSVALVVRLHKSIEFSDDRYFLLSCANRCSRPDCSSLLSNNQDAAQTRTPQSYLPAQSINRGFLTSESIISPILRASNDNPSHRQQVVDSYSNNLAVTERCDLMLDLKFQWLIKLCWILSILLLMMFCTSYYLCISLCKARSKHKRQLRNKRNSFKYQASALKANENNKQFIYPQANDSENFSWSEATTTTTTSAGMENLVKLREDNSILAKTQHHQQLLMPNHHLRVPIGPVQPQPQPQPQQQQLDETNRQQLVLGRSILGESFGSQNCKIDSAQRIKRRRSIGSSVVAPSDHILRSTSKNYNSSQHNQSQHQTALANRDIQTDRGKQLSSSQRAKSKSQTTIHYEQRQDPFETVPFSYLNNGYFSDSNTSPHPTQQRSPPPRSYSMNNQALISPAEVYGIDNQNQLNSYQAAQAPIAECLETRQSQLQHESADHLVSDQSNRAEVMRIQRWPNLNCCPPPQTEALTQQQLNSQFDPQNSRQLINLIQHKHRQQMAQANRTANLLANKQQQQRQNIPIQTRSWR